MCLQARDLIAWASCYLHVVLLGAPTLQQFAVLDVAAVLHAARWAVCSKCSLAGVEIVVEGVDCTLHHTGIYMACCLPPSLYRLKWLNYNYRRTIRQYNFCAAATR